MWWHAGLVVSTLYLWQSIFSGEVWNVWVAESVRRSDCAVLRCFFQTVLLFSLLQKYHSTKVRLSPICHSATATLWRYVHKRKKSYHYESCFLQLTVLACLLQLLLSEFQWSCSLIGRYLNLCQQQNCDLIMKTEIHLDCTCIVFMFHKMSEVVAGYITSTLCPKKAFPTFWTVTWKPIIRFW